jgi:zinc transport system ATP-binding protein
VYIARALAAEPDILILDEPTIAIDVASQNQFYQFLGSLNKSQKLTVIIVSHDIDVVAKEVSSVVCLNRGLVCHGTPAQFIKDEYLEKLYGKKVKFILHGH